MAQPGNYTTSYHITKHVSFHKDLCLLLHTNLLSVIIFTSFCRIWNVDKMAATAVTTLPHPSFVYTALFHVKVNKVVVTGGYDRIIRVWSVKGDDLHGHVSLSGSSWSTVVICILMFTTDFVFHNCCDSSLSKWPFHMYFSCYKN